MRGALQLLKHVVVHLVTRGAELLGVGNLQRGVEGAPEQHAADEASEREKSQAQMRAWAAGDAPEPDQECLEPLHRSFSLLLGADEKHVLERTRDERLCIGLLDVAGGAEVSARRDVGENLAVAVHEMGDADHRRTGAFGELASVAVEAAVGFQRELIIVDGVRDDRRLLRIVAHQPFVIDDRPRQGGHRYIAHRRGGAGDSRHDLGRVLGVDRATDEHQHAAEQGACQGLSNSLQAGMILTAHFLKSVCLEMGSVASSVTLLMSWLASNHGTKTTPRGIRLRPLVSIRLRISPRRETTRTSAPSLKPRARASSGCMKTRAPGNAL